MFHVAFVQVLFPGRLFGQAHQPQGRTSIRPNAMIPALVGFAANQQHLLVGFEERWHFR